MAEVSEEVCMQSAVNCDTCENTAEHLCKTCHDKLCSRCKDIHARSKSSFDHKIMPLTFESLSLSSELPSVQVCRSHPGFRANICCRECEIPVCENCLVGNHNGHTLIALKELFLIKKEKFENKRTFVESELPKYEAKLGAIREKQSSQAERTRLLKSQINSHFEEVESRLTKMKNRLLEMVNVKEETETHTLKIQESQILGYMNNIDLFLKNFESAVPSERNAFILYSNPFVGSTLPESFPSLPTLCMPQYSKGSLDDTTITTLSGKIYLNTDGLHLQAHFSEIEEINAGSNEIESLCFQLNDNTFWVYSQGKKFFAKINRVGKILFRFNACISNNKPICLYPDGTVFLRTDINVVTKLNQNGKGAIFVDFKDQSALPICMYLLQEERGIAIGIVNPELKEGKILQYSKCGQLIKEIKGPFLFRWFMQALRLGQKREPIYIAENINGDICISNTAVDVLDKNGEFRFLYNGSGKKRDTFLSRGICTDILGQILIAEKISLCIHILSIEGKFLKLMGIPGVGYLGYPITLTMDANYYLCVGCSNGKIKVLKYIE